MDKVVISDLIFRELSRSTCLNCRVLKDDYDPERNELVCRECRILYHSGATQWGVSRAVCDKLASLITGEAAASN